MAEARNTVVRLSRPVGVDGRMADALAFDGAPHSEKLPVTQRDGEFEIDTLAVLGVMAKRTGVSRPTIEKLPPIDLVTLALALFAPPVRQIKR